MKAMRKVMRIFITSLVLLLTISVVFSSVSVYAAGNNNENKHYMGSVVNAGHDTGFSENNKITEKDPHFGWTLGSFYVDGYTRVITEDENNPVFLKTVGDTVTLWFQLDQDINKLNGNKMLSIESDSNGYDEYFGIKKTEMGHGTLVIRHTDYQNHKAEPVIYTDYLAATATQSAAVEVKLCEEGDYEVALNYEIRKDNMDIFGWNPFPSYYNYRIFFRFSVRNGNCMVYPFDVTTGEELINTAITENGFYLDLAKSRYLDIDIKKETLAEGAEGLTEDVRFNRPAKDGDKYIEEGIYTITVRNKYTEQETIKRIYVGTNSVLKAHVVTGLSIQDINALISDGATINADGTIFVSNETIPPISTPEDNETLPDDDKTQNNEGQQPGNNNSDITKTSDFVLIFVIIGIVLVVAGGVILVIRKKKKQNTVDAESETESAE